MTLTVLSNDIPHNKNLETALGNSCLIRGMEKTILFDTGGDDPVLMSNLRKLGIPASNVDIVVLSHNHADHTEGMWKFLKANNAVKVSAPESFPSSFKEKVKSYKTEILSVENSTKVCEGVYTTGEMGDWIKEQSLILKTKMGLIVLTGCAHPGIANIVRRSKELLNDKPHLVLGGFHLGYSSEEVIYKIAEQLKELGVEKIAPNHCTGERAMEIFREVWGKDFVEAGLGAVIEVK